MMDKETAESESDLDTDNSDGFKFAVTLIVAFSTVAYKIYDYVGNNPVNDFWYGLLSILIPVSFTVLGLIVYIIIKGISLEIDSFQDRKKLENFSSLIYISTFKLFLLYIMVQSLYRIFHLLFIKTTFYFKGGMLIYVVIFLFVLNLGYSSLKVLQVKNYLEKGSFWKNFLPISKVSDLTHDKFSSKKKHQFFIGTYASSLLVIIFSFMYPFMYLVFETAGIKPAENASLNLTELLISLQLLAPTRYIWSEMERNIFTEYFNKTPQGDKVNSYSAIIFLIIFLIGSFILTPYFLTGSIKVEIDDNYFAKNNQIPVQIINKGYNENIIVNLSKTNIEGNMTILDSIEVHPTKNVNEVIFGEFLRSSTLDYGMYKIFINTTNLTQGYYELSVSEDFKKRSLFPIVKKAFNSFYLDKTEER